MPTVQVFQFYYKKDSSYALSFTNTLFLMTDSFRTANLFEKRVVSHQGMDKAQALEIVISSTYY